MGSSPGEVRSRSAKRRPGVAASGFGHVYQAPRLGLQLEPIRRRLALDVDPVQVLLGALVAGRPRSPRYSSMQLDRRQPVLQPLFDREATNARLRLDARSSRSGARSPRRSCSASNVSSSSSASRSSGSSKIDRCALRRPCATPARRASCSSASWPCMATLVARRQAAARSSPRSRALSSRSSDAIFDVTPVGRDFAQHEASVGVAYGHLLARQVGVQRHHRGRRYAAFECAGHDVADDAAPRLRATGPPAWRRPDRSARSPSQRCRTVVNGEWDRDRGPRSVERLFRAFIALRGAARTVLHLAAVSTVCDRRRCMNAVRRRAASAAGPAGDRAHRAPPPRAARSPRVARAHVPVVLRARLVRRRVGRHRPRGSWPDDATPQQRVGLVEQRHQTRAERSLRAPRRATDRSGPASSAARRPGRPPAAARAGAIVARSCPSAHASATP